MTGPDPQESIFLTFDDGPCESFTSQILDILKSHDAKATFFVCGKNAEKHPEAIKRIIQEGHAIGCHSYSHGFYNTISGKLITETEQTAEVIQKYSGIKTRLCRSPWGITMPWLKRKLKTKGFSVYFWNIMAFDWLRPSPEFIASHITKRAFPGAIVLLHDGDGIRQGNRTNTVEALPLILSSLSKQGYTFKPLDGAYNNRKTIKNYLSDLLLGIKYWF